MLACFFNNVNKNHKATLSEVQSFHHKKPSPRKKKTSLEILDKIINIGWLKNSLLVEWSIILLKPNRKSSLKWDATTEPNW